MTYFKIVGKEGLEAETVGGVHEVAPEIDTDLIGTAAGVVPRGQEVVTGGVLGVGTRIGKVDRNLVSEHDFDR